MRQPRLTCVVILFALTVTALNAQPGDRTRAAAVDEHLAFLEQAYAARSKPDAAQWKERVHAKRGDLAATLDALVAADRGGDALRFAIPFAYFLVVTNQPQQALDALNRALDVPSARAATSARARALYEAGRIEFRQRNQERSRALNEEGLQIARKLDDGAAAANALIGLSRVALRAHDFAAVKARAQEAAALRAKLGDEAGRLSAMHMVAAAMRMEGEDAAAQQIYESTLAGYRASGDKRAAAGELFNLGYVHLHQNRVDKAESLFKEALSEHRALQYEPGVAYCITGLAAVAAARKQPLRAAELYGSAAAILERLGITLDPDDQLDWDRYTALARTQLDEPRYAAAFAKGRVLPKEEAIALATATVE